MEEIRVPYKVKSHIATYQGEWTADQIEKGEAGEPSIEVYEQWYENIDGRAVPITDPLRIAELEQG